MITTPRDAIGLSDRLREDFLRGEITVWNTLPEAAAVLDALQARVKELEAEQAAIVRDYQRMNSQLADEMKHATRAEQERDEALERLKPFADAAESLYESHLDLIDLWESPSGLEITAGHLRAARDLVRRLAAGDEEGK